jgi:electron transfer flavoprotein beta subunit
MRIFVCIKQVPDTETRIKLKPDSSDIDGNGVKWIVNPYDEFAIEEAVKIKEAHQGATVTVVSVGPKARLTSSLRTAMAMGCDDGILIDEANPLDSLTTAKAMAKAIKNEGDISAVFTGVLNIDDNESSVGPMVAELLEIPHVGVVSKLDSNGDEWTAEREVEGGTKEVFTIKLPGLITATKGLNKPRFASLPNIMKAKKKPIKETNFGDLGLNSDDVKIQLNQYQMPAEKEPVKMLSGEPTDQVNELIKLLRDEAKVL